jgi:hypothetical protein
MRGKRWFRLGAIGWLCTTGLSVGFMSYAST